MCGQQDSSSPSSCSGLLPEGDDPHALQALPCVELGDGDHSPASHLLERLLEPVSLVPWPESQHKGTRTLPVSCARGAAG